MSGTGLRGMRSQTTSDPDSSKAVSTVVSLYKYRPPRIDAENYQVAVPTTHKRRHEEGKAVCCPALYPWYNCSRARPISDRELDRRADQMCLNDGMIWTSYDDLNPLQGIDGESS